MWNKMCNIIRVAEEILGEPKESWLQLSESWWWSGEIQKAIKQK